MGPCGRVCCPATPLGQTTVFAEPTVEDFISRVDWHISRARDRALAEVARIRADAARRGVLSSSATIQLSLDAARKAFEAGVDDVLGELNRAIRTTKLDPNVLRDHVGQRLRQFAGDAKQAAQVGKLARLYDPRPAFAALDQHLDFALRQFDVGFHNPSEPEVPPVANAINIGTMTGSTIQQGSPNATQNVQFTLNVESVRTALDQLDIAIADLNLPATTLAELQADIGTIRAQLSKPSPSLPILREAGRTLRNVIEGIAASALTPTLIAVAPALWSALGLG